MDALRTTIGIGSTFVSVLLGACGGGEDTTPTPLAREVNYLQCQGSKAALAQVDQALAAAGVQASILGCASDGAVFVAACDTPAYYLRSVEVPKFQEQVARSLGFRAPSEFTKFIPGNCPAV